MADDQDVWLQFPLYPLEFNENLASDAYNAQRLAPDQQAFLQALGLISDHFDHDVQIPTLAPWPRTLLHQLIKYQVRASAEQVPLHPFWTLLKVIHDCHGLPWYELFTAEMDVQTPDAIPKLIKAIRQRDVAEWHEPAMVKAQNHQRILHHYDSVLATRIPQAHNLINTLTHTGLIHEENGVIRTWWHREDEIQEIIALEPQPIDDADYLTNAYEPRLLGDDASDLFTKMLPLTLYDDNSAGFIVQAQAESMYAAWRDERRMIEGAKPSDDLGNYDHQAWEALQNHLAKLEKL